MLNMKQKRCLVYALMTAMLLSVAAFSMVQARTEDVSSPPAADENTHPSSDTPVLIMTLDGNVTVPESPGDEPNLYQAQDDPAATEDNSTRVVAQDDTENNHENSLISPQTSPDPTVPMVGIAGLLAAVASIGAFLLVRKRKATD